AEATPAEIFSAHLGALYPTAQQSQHLFASPLGPVYFAGRNVWLPRFVFFGPHASDASWRLAFLSGFDASDLRPAQALLGLSERLAERAEDGHGLDLTFFPLVAAANLATPASARSLATEHWGRSTLPEIGLLEKDARLRSYHGYIRVEAAAPGDDIITVRVREPLGLVPSPDVELISSIDVDPFPVRFERGPAGVAPTDGPLSIADDLPVQPFELTLRVPATWPDEIYQDAVSLILTRFIHRYRAFQAYGQHL
ncbi:MAG: hypothetical protein NTV51_01935, partial [Verrucomicrobia bacterium]|nr:hypothetical protein [Verrucomicrobiota bacterium]